MKPNTSLLETIAYLTECTLATIESLATNKVLRTSELRRRTNIAQVGIDALREAGVTECPKCPRCTDVLSGPKVWGVRLFAEYARLSRENLSTVKW